MTCYYDEGIFETYRAKAISDASQLKIGQTYYTNYPEKFTVKEILTAFEFHNGKYENDSKTELRWIRTDSGRELSLFDHNIGEHYNPWLIFEKEEDATDCRNNLKVDIVYEDRFEYDPRWG